MIDEEGAHNRAPALHEQMSRERNRVVDALEGSETEYEHRVVHVHVGVTARRQGTCVVDPMIRSLGDG